MTDSTLDSSWPSGSSGNRDGLAPHGVSRHRGGRAVRILGWVSVAIAAVLSVPVITVAAHFLIPTESEVWGHLARTVLPRYLWNTLWLVLGVGIAAPVIGTGTAWLVTMYRFPGRPVFEWALILPLAVPAYVMAYAYTDFLQVTGPVQTALRALLDVEAGAMWFPQVRSLPGAIAMMTFVLYPYVYLLARASFLEQSVCALEVGRTLGYGPWRNFLRVALPLARPSIAGGTALVLMEALSDFGTVSYFGVQTFTTGIVRVWSSYGDPVAASQLAGLLLAVVFAVLVVERLSRGRARYHHTSARYRQLPRTTLPPGKQALASLGCALPIVAGFLLPAAILLGMAITAAQRSYALNFVEMAVNSFSLAAVTAVLAVVLATVMVYGRRLCPGRASMLANRVAGLGYAIPGTVIAIGVLVPFTAAENAVDAWLRAQLGVSTGLVLTGTIAALVFAYLVRFLAVALNTVEASLAKVRPTMEDAARTLGHGPTSTLLRVHAPLVSGSMLTAGLLVFVDVLKELPATLVLRPFDYDTLAVQAYNLASDERLTEAATPALTIVAVGILPVIILSKTIARSRPGH